MSTDVAGDNTILVDGNDVTGTLIGGPAFFFSGAYSSAFRADITALNLVSAGPNMLTVDGLVFSKVANGAGVLVVFDDGSGTAEIDLKDGLDNAFINFPEPRKSTVPQTFNFAPAGVDRLADFSLFFSSVAGTVSGQGADRPTSIEVTVNGTTTVFSNLLASLDGQEWDTVNIIDFPIPAGASSLTVQAFSRDDNNTGNLPASFTWTAAGLSLPTGVEIEKFTNGYDADNADGIPVPTPPLGPGFPGDVGGDQVPVVKIGDEIIWTYVVTNTSSETLINIKVTDSKEGVTVICPSTTLAPAGQLGDSFTCTAMGTSLDLADDPTSVEGCDSQGQGMTVPTYENLGTVVGFGATSGVEVTDEDPSHYCNPPDVLIKKFTNGYDGDDGNGIPAAGQGDFTVGAPQVAEVPSGGDITWTYVVTNTSDERLSNIVVTDDRGVTVTCPAGTTLAAGASFTCTAMGTAEDLQPGDPNVDGCGSGTGETRPTYENLGMVEAMGDTTGVFVEDDDPSHYCNPPPPPPCGLTLEKGCEIPPPAPPSVGKCAGKLQQYTVIWNGAGPIDIAVGDGLTGSSAQSANPGDAVTFFADGSTNDTIVNISGSSPGQSTFHVSCSDRDMDGDTATNEEQQQVSPIGRDCGKDQGNGKDKSGFNNQWLLEGFVDNNGDVLDCTLDVGVGDDSCTFQAVAADCDFPVNDPDILTFRVSGGDCNASDNAQKPDKTECVGDFIDPDQKVLVSVNGETAFTLEPGGTFDVERGGDPEIELFQGDVAQFAQFNKFHGSCSQPLQAGDKYGANELVLLDGSGLGTNVVYSYLVGNDGPGDLTGIEVTDDQLGSVPGSPIDLAEGFSETLTAMAFITQETINTATAVASCEADSNPVVVTVLPPPPCDVSIAFKELKDDAIKWDLTNDSLERKATLETFTLVFPDAFGSIKEVKLDGAIFKADDSDKYPDGVPSGVTIGPADWTNLEVAKRQLDQGEKRTLEVKFTDKSKDFGSDDFTLTLTFEEGCIIGFNTTP